MLLRICVLLLPLVMADNASKSKEVAANLLSMEWPYGYCQKGDTSCFIPSILNAEPRFTLHGLWPEYADWSGGPQSCTSTPFSEYEIESIRSRMDKEWPTLMRKNTNVMFWTHEWSKHGTCSIYNASQLDYFTAGLDIGARYSNFTAVAKKASLKADVPATFEEVVDGFKIAYGKTVAPKCGGTWKGDNSSRVISEVRFCLDKDMNLINCPQSVMNFYARGCGRQYEKTPVVFPAPYHS